MKKTLNEVGEENKTYEIVHYDHKATNQKNIKINPMSFFSIFVSAKDPFVDCAGDVHRKCFETGEKAWEHKENTLKVFLTPLQCYENNAKLKKCKSPILRHMIEFMQAFKKHLEEKHGLLGGLVAEI